MSTFRQAALWFDSGHQLPGHSIQLIGEPRWENTDLAAIASKEGNVAALNSAYKATSENCLTSIFGKFALLVYDTLANRVVAATDRMGREPVYYRQIDGRIQVSSTVEDLIDGDDKRISSQGIYNYIYFHMVPSPGSIYPRIEKLRAGELLVWEGGEVRRSRYWVPDFGRRRTESRSQLSNELRSRLSDSVTRCLSKTGPTGAFLSGGLDSSTVTGFLAQASDTRVEAFAIGFDVKGYDEIPYARITAKHFGVKLNEYYVTPKDIVEELPRIATYFGEPFGNSSALPVFFCARFAASHGIRHLLAGDGGDEIFAGNARYRTQQILERYSSIPLWLRQSVLEPVAKLLPTGIPIVSKVKSYIQQAMMPMPERTQSYNFLSRHTPDELFCVDFLHSVNTSEPADLIREVYFFPEHASQLDRMLYMDWQLTLADNDLRKVGSMCQLAGVEVSYPMLDDDLVALSLKVSDALKIRKGNLRDFYKSSLKGWLPDATIEKGKHGFGLPFGNWLHEYKPLRELALDSLLELKKRPYFKPEFIDRTIDLHKSGHTAYYGELVWILVVLELWLKKNA